MHGGRDIEEDSVQRLLLDWADSLLVLEAMFIRQALRSWKDGTLK